VLIVILCKQEEVLLLLPISIYVMHIYTSKTEYSVSDSTSVICKFCLFCTIFLEYSHKGLALAIFNVSIIRAVGELGLCPGAFLSVGVPPCHSFADTGVKCKVLTTHLIPNL
jgi:hypothetical protein